MERREMKGPQPETRQTREEAKPPTPVGWWLWRRVSAPFVSRILHFVVAADVANYNQGRERSLSV